jgi:hypothetical protein
MNRMRKCNDEVYQLAKDQALVKKLKNKREVCRSSEISVDLIIITVYSLFVDLVIFVTF